MTQRLPIPGADSSTWGDILNSFLEVSLYNNTGNGSDPNNGTLNSGVVGTAQIANNAVTNALLDVPTQTTLATVASKYTKPGGGIPASDLTSAVQTNLTAAGTAVQTVNSVSPTSGNVSIGLHNLSDTSGVSGAATNQVLQYNGSQWAPGTVTSTTVSNATSTVPGIIQLAGDLSNTATAPNVSTVLGGQTPVSTSTTLGGGLSGTLPNPTVTAVNLSSPLSLGQGGTGSGTQNFVDLTTSQSIGGTKTYTTAISTAAFKLTGGTPGLGKVLVSDAAGNASWGTASSGSTTLSGDTDVALSTLTNGQVLTYSTGSVKWVNQTLPSAANGTLGLIELAGDLGGTATSPSVAKIQGTTVSAPSGGTTAFLNASGTWTTPTGSGNMNTSTYDPAGIDQQVVGLSATQTLTNKSISGSQITSAVANATNAVNATNATNATTATTATTANTVTTIPALTGDVTSSGSSNGTTLTSSSNVESVISANATVTGALQKANNLSDIVDAGTTRANIHVPALTPVACATTTNVATMSGLNAYDGYTTVSGDLILLTGQTTASQNGLWTAAAGSWTRPTEFATGTAVKARTVAVIQGTAYGGSTWLLQTNTSITVGTTSQTWVQQVTNGLLNASSATAGQQPTATGSGTAIFRNPLDIDPTSPEFNAKFDWNAYYANTASGSNSIHVGASTVFTSADIGKQMIIKRAGNAGGTASLWGWIGGASAGNALLYTDKTYATPANAASTQSGVQVAWGSDDTTALNAAFAASAASGGQRCVRLPAGWARASQLAIPNGCKIRSAGWGSSWGVFGELNSGSTLAGQTNTTGTLLQQLEGQTTDFITFNTSDFNSGNTLGFVGPLDIELGAVEGPFVPGPVGSPTGTQNGVAFRTPDGATHADVPCRPQDGFRLKNTHVICFPGDAFNFPNGVVPLQGFTNNRAFYNGGYGFNITSISGGEIQMAHLENFSGDSNSLGLVMVNGYNEGGGGVFKISALKSEANSFSQLNMNTNSHEWVPTNDIAQLNCITLNNCTGHFMIEADHIAAAYSNSPTDTTYYTPGPLITIQGTGTPSITFDANVRNLGGGTLYPGSAGPVMINDTVNTITVPNTVMHGYYNPGGTVFPYQALTKTADQNVNSAGTETIVISFPLLANSVKVGSHFRIRARGVFSAATAGTLQASLRCGTAGTVADGLVRSTSSLGGVTSATGFEIDGDLTVQAVGATGKVNGNVRLSVATSITMSVGTAQLTVDTTTGENIDLTLTAGGTTPSAIVINASVEPVLY